MYSCSMLKLSVRMQWWKQVGAYFPPQFSPGNFTIYQEKRDKEGKWRGKEGKFEREEVENWKWKGIGMKMSRGLLFIYLFIYLSIISLFIYLFILLVTFWNHWSLFGVYQYGQFYQENHISCWDKIRKPDFAPSEKYYSYAAAQIFRFNYIWLQWYVILHPLVL